ncbi:hypothetical protein QFC21_000426 [Naganishia friedmannii]|uniref:Uncharacterized protein n=1 Tax=Naganishia friedmannii TaxID=89922 RepID=A0ACC2WCJ2_9TREE|nr:hypothetical protein QFC21_000426 [Naganishia friedmannii]
MSPTTTTQQHVADLQIGLIGMGEATLKEEMKGASVSGRPASFRPSASSLMPSSARVRERSDVPNIKVLKDGHQVSRISDFIIYSVEAEYISQVVKTYGPSTKPYAIVAGQTSVKAPEKEAFEKYLPDDVYIVSVHSLHGPTVTTEGQPLVSTPRAHQPIYTRIPRKKPTGRVRSPSQVIIQHRAPDEKVRVVEQILESFKSRYVHLTYEEHDLVTANTQAVTHAAFLSMGTAWKNSQDYPWETSRYVGGIEIVKINIALRIYSNKWHVYAGLAILNPSAREQIRMYAACATDIFKLMVEERKEVLRERMYAAREGVFGWTREQEGEGEGDGEGEGEATTGATTTTTTTAIKQRKPILLSDRILDQFSLGPKPNDDDAAAAAAGAQHGPNSHLSLLAMVDCWHKLGIKPYAHLDVAGTPVFMLWIGVAEYLFRSTSRLEMAVECAIRDKTHRSDDTEFVVAARGWSQCVSFGSFDLYRSRFEETASFFAPRFQEATVVGGKMIKTILDESAQVKAAAEAKAASQAASDKTSL